MTCTLRLAAYVIILSGFAILTEGLPKVRFRSGIASYPRTSGGSGSGSASIGLILGIFFGSLGGIILSIIFCVCLAKWAKSRTTTVPKRPTFTGQTVHGVAPAFSSTQPKADTIRNPMTDQSITPFSAPADGLYPAYDPAWCGQTGLPYPVTPFMSPPPFREPVLSSPPVRSEIGSVSFPSEKGM